MGERKGQNFYYPPDFDYKKHKSLNSYHGTHALRERAAKIKQGILIIRFEMPFNIWCLGCNNHIGMGVRYNAEKKKVGMYYTTPLYEFRMKCHLCDNYFVIRTDPEHYDYELVEGCRRQEKRYDPSTIDQLGAVDRGFSRQLESDRMFQIEHVEQDKEKASSSANQVVKLEWIQERMRDDFAANQALRQSFHREKLMLKDERARDEGLLRRTSLNIELVPESAEDKSLARMVLRHKKIKFPEEKLAEKIHAIFNKPIFHNTQPSDSTNLCFTQKGSRSVKFRKSESTAFNLSSTTGGQRQTTAITLGVVVKRKKGESEEMDGGDNQKDHFKGDSGDVKPDIEELSHSVGQEFTDSKEECTPDKNPERSIDSKCISLVADYASDSSSENFD